MYTMPVETEQLDELRSLVIRQRWDWPFVFSCNWRRETWPFVRYGYTHEGDRQLFEHPIVDSVVETYLEVRPAGGRVMISQRGAFFKNEEGEELQFLTFQGVN